MCEPLTCTLWGNGGWLGWRQEPARERGQGAGAAGAVGPSSSRLAGRVCRPNTASTCDPVTGDVAPAFCSCSQVSPSASQTFFPGQTGR